MVSRRRLTDNAIEHRSVNACLAPLCSVDGCSVTTVEGIVQKDGTPHPSQERIAKMHGSRCGFCTPGIVMSLHTLLTNKAAQNWKTLKTVLMGIYAVAQDTAPSLMPPKLLQSIKTRAQIQTKTYLAWILLAPQTMTMRSKHRKKYNKIKNYKLWSSVTDVRGNKDSSA